MREHVRHILLTITSLAFLFGGCVDRPDRRVDLPSVRLTPAPITNPSQYGAEANPTGNPIGGGVDYTNRVFPHQATYYVFGRPSFLDALAVAAPGETIYIADDAIIDLTGYSNVEIPGGVTVASGRGRAGSLGALLRNSHHQGEEPLFLCMGNDVRFTGVRLQGPDSEIGDKNTAETPLSNGIKIEDYTRLEVDNCELSGWGGSAISLWGEDVVGYVHHNHIHNNHRKGYGYGVALHKAKAIIEANLFDRCRHSITGGGAKGTSYEARYNVILSHATSHAFDMHGAIAYNKYKISANWRFDEGRGNAAEDSSIKHDNHCTLNDTDAVKWTTDAIFGSALSFDGTPGSFLTCNTDESMGSSVGTLDFWLQTRDVGRDQDLVYIYDDHDNYLLLRLNHENQLAVLLKDGDLEYGIISNVKITDSAYHHMAFTQADDGITIYVDGESVSLSGEITGLWTDHLDENNTHLKIGAGPDGNYFRGVLDEVRLYHEALDDEEVALHSIGLADISGTKIVIHHNTFYNTTRSAIGISAKPAKGAWIHHNWFHNDDASGVLWQRESQGNV